jgi:hypothetical protein
MESIWPQPLIKSLQSIPGESLRQHCALGIDAYQPFLIISLNTFLSLHLLKVVLYIPHT